MYIDLGTEKYVFFRIPEDVVPEKTFLISTVTLPSLPFRQGFCLKSVMPAVWEGGMLKNPNRGLLPIISASA